MFGDLLHAMNGIAGDVFPALDPDSDPYENSGLSLPCDRLPFLDKQQSILMSKLVRNTGNFVSLINKHLDEIKQKKIPIHLSFSDAIKNHVLYPYKQKLIEMEKGILYPDDYSNLSDAFYEGKTSISFLQCHFSDVNDMFLIESL